ncbi:MAG TPA: acyl-CoA dehydrogenase family protein [Candidatus Dormibacteraeota bacterium]|nr:acyl-CoA dehydrogenase family protein [Candidatus Dormibacteraeota bacterium]
MDFAMSPEQRELQAQARSFLEVRFPLSRMAQLADSEVGWDPDSWRELGELGWLGVSAPESLGGAGLGFLEEAIVLEELGRCLYAGPYLATVALALPALDDARRAKVASGGQRWSAALWQPDGPVPDLDRVDQVVVAVDDQLLAVDPKGERLSSIDPTRTLGRLLSSAGESLHRGEEAARITRVMHLRLWTALAIEAVGGAQRVLELAVDHARTREQFGRPIGSYQAVAHPLADSYVEVELARSLAYWAAWCLSVDHQDSAIAASAAKAAAAEAYVRACERTIQALGGIGFTWESPVHHYYKRALWIEAFAGRPRQHRAQVAVHLGLNPYESSVQAAGASQQVGPNRTASAA